MNRPIGALWIVAGLAGATGAAHAQQTPNAMAPLRAASQPVISSAAVQAAEDARMPGEMRPEKRPVPQLVVPLKRAATTDEGAAPTAAVPPGGVDDEVARCLASRDRRERAACQALTQGRKPVTGATSRAG